MTTRAPSTDHISPPQRFLLRALFCWFLLYALFSGEMSLWRLVPHYGTILEIQTAKHFANFTRLIAVPLFHLHGTAARVHNSGYNDHALDWIGVGLMAVIALMAAIVWTLTTHPAYDDRKLHEWLRLLVRITLCGTMLLFGFIKLFPVQITPPSLATLNEPVGDTSPLVLVWTLLGSNPTYERACAFPELLAGLLLLFRRTTLAGALAAVAVLTNILLLNCFFDIPVKLYTAMLLLMAFTLIAPDASALWSFFIRHDKPRPLTNLRSPLPITLSLLLYACFLYAFCIATPLNAYRLSKREQANRAHPSPLTGQWHLDFASFDGTRVAFPIGEGQPLADLFFEPTGRITERTADGALWPADESNQQPHTLHLAGSAHGPAYYNIIEPDPDHLILQPSTDPTDPELHFTRVAIPRHYRLFDRGFHLINEWGFEQ